MSPVASVIVPAHNEAALITRLLSAIVDEGAKDDLEVLVVANACTDDTAVRARAILGDTNVIEIEEASKIAAINAGDRAASTFPRIYIDADVMVSGETVRALGRYLAAVDGPFAASAAFDVDTARSTWAARAYYRVWEQSEYRRRGHIGSGIYGVTEAGRARFAEFPDVIADDRFVQLLFAPGERGILPGHSFSVHAPRTLGGQIKRATRIALGNQELAAVTGLRAHESALSGYKKLVMRVLVRPSLWLSFPIYMYAYLVPQLMAHGLRLRGRRGGWNRDESSRS